jgi:hypothetical protein
MNDAKLRKNKLEDVTKSTFVVTKNEVNGNLLLSLGNK